MAKQYKQPSIVSGLSVQDIINMDINKFNSLNKSDLQKVVGRLVSAGNKRLRSFERSGESSPATRHVTRSGGMFSTKGKDINELRAEYARAKNFMTAKTGTRAGWKKTKRETIKSLNEKGINLTEKQFDDFWQAYEELKEMNPSVATKGLKYNTLKDIADMVTDNTLTADEIALKMNNEISKIYEEQAGLNDGFSGVSGFFK